MTPSGIIITLHYVGSEGLLLLVFVNALLQSRALESPISQRALLERPTPQPTSKTLIYVHPTLFALKEKWIYAKDKS